MNIEHFAFNVADPEGMAAWWTKNLGMQVVYKSSSASRAHFLAYSKTGAMIEIYHGKAPVPDYAAMEPGVLHVAFACKDVAAERQRLIDAGATPVGDVEKTSSGDDICVVRDPFGLAVQLIDRKKPFI